MGQRILEIADQLVRRGNRRRLRQLLRKHPELRTSNDSMLIFTAIWRHRDMLRWLL